MDANAATIIAGVLGAVIGGPAGFFIERLINRPKLKISYAEAAYEDIYSFPAEVAQGLLTFPDFLDFVGTQVKWSIRQRVTANLFNREELRLTREFGQHYLDYIRALAARAEDDVVPMLRRGGQDIDRFLPELEPYYIALYKDRVLTDDLAQDRPGALQRLISTYTTVLNRYRWKEDWLRRFLELADQSLKKARGISDRMIIRVSIGNSGYQDAIIHSEARLRAGSMIFKAPMQIASRPWELSEVRGPSQFYVISPKAFLVLEFLLDENLNATADLGRLRSDLQRGTSVVLETVKLGGETAVSHSFVAQLREPAN